MEYTHKKITYDKNHALGGHTKCWAFYSDDMVCYVSPQEFSASSLTDLTERDAFGGINAEYNN